MTWQGMTLLLTYGVRDVLVVPKIEKSVEMVWACRKAGLKGRKIEEICEAFGW
jgi:hypothetical protein